MSDTTSAPNPAFSALFANLVIQNVSMAMIFLGHTPHPETGKTEVNLDHARVFIDTLEMLEAKTRGNLDKDEERFLKQNLISLRMAYVEAVNQSAAPPAATPIPEAAPASAAAPASGESQSAAPEAKPVAEAESESHKKFTKKY
jgi:hypothetical protein